MVGITSEEGLMKTATFFNKNHKKLTDDLVNNWDTILPYTFYYDHLPDSDQKEITAKLNDYYMNNEPFEYSKRENLTNLYGDGLFIGILDNLEFRLKDNIRDNTFVYLFSHKGSASFSELLNGESDKFYGTCHADELMYLFPLQKTNPVLFSSIPTEEDRKLSKLMIELWVNFAKTGKPTPEWTKDSDYPYWISSRKFPLDYMSIGNLNGNRKELFSMEKGLFDERQNFWRVLRSEHPKLTEWTFKEEKKYENDEL